MNSWFSPETSQAFVWLSSLSLLTLLRHYSRLGRYRNLVLGVWLAVLAFGCLCLGAAGLALVLEQPAHVVRPLAVTGVVLTIVLSLSYARLKHAYQEAELRRMIAQDLR